MAPTTSRMTGGQLLESLYYQISSETGDFERGMDRTEGRIRRVGGTARAGAIALGALGVALTAVAVKAVHAASQFKDAFAEVRTIMDMTESQAASMRRELLELSEQVPETATKLTKGLYQAISAGATDAAEAMELVAVASKLATVGLSDTFTTVDALTTIVNAYGMSMRDAAQVSDQMFETVRLGKIQLDQLASSVGTAAPFFAQLGVETKELFAAIATLTKGGIRAEITMTALRAMMMMVLKPQEDAVRLAKQLGFEYSATAVQTMGLWKWLQQVSNAIGGNVELIGKLFPNVRGLVGVLNLAGKQADTFTEILESMGDATGATQRAFAIMADRTSTQVTLLKNRVTKAFIGMGEAMLRGLKVPLAEMGSWFEEPADVALHELRRIQGEMERVEKTIKPLADEYVKLTQKVALTADEHERLKEIMETLGTDTIPGLVTRWDEYGNAVELNIGALDRYMRTQGAMEEYWRSKTIEELTNSVEMHRGAIETLNERSMMATRSMETYWRQIQTGAGDSAAAWKAMQEQAEVLVRLDAERAWNARQLEAAEKALAKQLKEMGYDEALRTVQEYLDASRDVVDEELRVTKGRQMTREETAAFFEALAQLRGVIPGLVGELKTVGGVFQEPIINEQILARYIDFLDALAPLGEKAADQIAKAKPQLQRAMAELVAQAEETVLTQQYTFAKLMGYTTAETLDQFRMVLLGMEDETKEALASLTEAWIESLDEGTRKIYARAREETKLRGKYDVELVVVDMHGKPVDLKRWRADQQKVLADDLTQKIVLLLEAETGRATTELGVLGGGLRSLADDARNASGVLSDVVLPALDNWLYKMQEMVEVGRTPEGEPIFEPTGAKAALPIMGATAAMGLFTTGVRGIMGALFGGAKAAREAERRLREARDALDAFTEALPETTEPQLKEQERLLVDLQRRWKEYLDAERDYVAVNPLKDFAEKNRDLFERLGLPATAEGFGQVEKALEAVRDQLEQFTAFDVDTLTGQMERLRWQFELFDVTDPIEKWNELKKIVTELPDFDIGTPEGRRKLEKILAYLSGLKKIPDSLDDIAAELGLPLAEVEAILRDLPDKLLAGEGRMLAEWLEDILDEIESGQKTAEDQGEDIIRRAAQVGLTEAWGDTALGEWMTIRRHVAGIHALMEAALGLRAEGATVSEAAVGSASYDIDVGGISVHLGTGPADVAEAPAVGAEVGNQIAETFLRRVRSRGGLPKRFN